MPIEGHKKVGLELRQLAGAEQCVVAHQNRRRHFAVPELGRLQVEHEGAEGALDARQSPLEHDEARARHARRGLEVHHAERFADLEVLLGREFKGWRLADPAQLLVSALIGADRHVVRRQVRKAREQRIELGRQGAGALLALLNPAFQLGDLGHCGPRIGAPALGRADVLRRLVAARLHVLQFSLAGPQARVDIEDCGGVRLEAALGESCVKRLRVVADRLDVEHLSEKVLWRSGPRRPGEPYIRGYPGSVHRAAYVEAAVPALLDPRARTGWRFHRAAGSARRGRSG